MIIGIDFDNTIACYENVFYNTACELNLIPDNCGKTKNNVRDYIRKYVNDEKWTELQGIVYGSKMSKVKPFTGFRKFLLQCREKSITVFIISHKTKYSKKGKKYNLRKSANNWLRDNFIYPKTLILKDNIYFCSTRLEKIEKIRECSCTYFIDDLPEVFEEPSFPESINKILFSPNGKYNGDWDLFCNWDEITSYLL